jgi:hypothetical protein
MSKLEDAVRNLLLRASPRNGNQDRDSGHPNPQPGKGAQSAAKRESGTDAQPNTGRQGDAPDGQPGEAGRGDGQNEGRNSQRAAGGIGSQEGDKSIKPAQSLDAIRKVSELYGKRAATLTGEATVEVQATNQQLRTQYVQRGAQHLQGGAEIDRDVVPVELQSNV